MAEKIFKGMKFVKESTFTAATFTAETDVLYFVRTDNPADKKTDGYLYFNGKKYGTGEDAIEALKTFYGELKVGNKDATVAEYVAKQLESVAKLTDFEAVSGQTVANKTAIDTLKDGDTVDGSVAKSIKDAVEALDVAKVGGEGKFIQSIEEVDGKISAVTGELSAANVSSSEVTGDDSRVAVIGVTVQSAVESLATSIKTVEKEAGEKIKSVSGSSAIVVDGTATEPTVSLKLADGDNAGNVVLSQDKNGLKAQLDADKIVKIKDGDKVLSFSNSELSASVSLSYNSTNKTIYLYGKDNSSAISTIDATDFIKDGMLESAELVTTAETGVENLPEVPYLKLTFNSDAKKDIIRFSVKDLVDVYTAKEKGGLKLNDHAFEVDFDVVAPLSGLTAATEDIKTLSGSTVKIEETVGNDEKGLVKDVNDLKKDVSIIKGDEKTEGSIKKAVAAAKSELAGSDASLSGDTSIAGAKKYTDAKVEELEKELNEQAVTLKVPNNDPYLEAVTASTTGGGTAFTISSNETAITSAITTKIESLDAIVSGEANGIKVTVSEADGKLTSVAVDAPNFADTYATKSDFNTFTGRTEGFATEVQGGKADSAVQSVNRLTGTSVTIDASVIQAKAGTDTESTAYTGNVSAVLADIYKKIGAVAVTSSNKTITVADDGRDIGVNLEAQSEGTVAAGHIQITHGENGALYGVMYCAGDDVE